MLPKVRRLALLRGSVAGAGLGLIGTTLVVDVDDFPASGMALSGRRCRANWGCAARPVHDMPAKELRVTQYRTVRNWRFG